MTRLLHSSRTTPKTLVHCDQCGTSMLLAVWFDAMQTCPECGNTSIRYGSRSCKDLLPELVRNRDGLPGLWRYFDTLPLESRDNVVTSEHESAPIHRWPFLEKIAAQQGIHIKVLAHRYDLSPGTNTFKDLAASLAVSAYKEHGVTDLAISSTGNISVAYAKYAARAGIRLTAFLPRESDPINATTISLFGQKAIRVLGDYSEAKQAAAEYSRKHGALLAATSQDPLRLEAKKTIPYEWRRQLDEFPTVYIQALSGGTGPMAVDMGCRDLMDCGLIKLLPRLILVQSDTCPPMATSWAEAEKRGFPEGWENDYHTLKNPKTEIVTLATGNPILYPQLATRVRHSNGTILTFPEQQARQVAQLTGLETQALLGPASCMAIGGFFSALSKGQLSEGDVVAVMIGENAARSMTFIKAAERELHSLSPDPAQRADQLVTSLLNGVEKNDETVFPATDMTAPAPKTRTS